jgi:hypothetical protein
MSEMLAGQAVGAMVTGTGTAGDTVMAGEAAGVGAVDGDVAVLAGDGAGAVGDGVGGLAGVGVGVAGGIHIIHIHIGG